MDARAALLVMNRELHRALGDVFVGLTDNHLMFIAPALDARPFGEVVVHAYRPVLAATCVVAGREWPSRRPRPTTAPALGGLVEAMVAEVDGLLAGLADEALARPVTLRWGAHESGLDAIATCLAHGFVHVGALRGARASGGFPTPAEE